MTALELRFAFARDLTSRRLLDHPFYLRWRAGQLRLDDIAAYAEQYRYFERALPRLLRTLLTQVCDEAAAGFVRRNLADEEGVPAPHATLFEDFATATGARPDVAPSVATRLLVDIHDDLTAESAASGLAAIVAYELQAPDVAASKAQGLRAWYGLDARATRFWDVHATMDTDHAQWGIEALAQLDAGQEEVGGAARRALDAWWKFLDDREGYPAAAAAAEAV